jgi:hypothetical protein
MPLSTDLAAAYNFARFQTLAELALHPHIIDLSIEMESGADIDSLVSGVAGMAYAGERPDRPFAKQLDLVEGRLKQHFTERTTNLAMQRLMLLVYPS